MDFSLTPEQRAIQALARDVAEAEIAPHATAWDRDHTFPRALFSKLGELGLMGVCVPEELGGAGADFLSYILVLEELSRADAGVGVTVAVHTSAVTLPILAFGTPEQRQRFVPDLAAGRMLGAFALTEPDSGSDAGALRSTAVPDGDGWRLSGVEAVDHERQPRRHVPRLRAHRPVRARHARRQRLPRRRQRDRGDARGGEAGPQLVVDRRHPLRRAFVGRDRLLHEENRGFRVAMATLDGGRIGIAAQAVGIAQAAYDVARRYAVERRQFGSRIADFQAIQFKLADMATEIAAARQLVYKAAWLKEEGLPHSLEGAQAKLFASGVARRQTGEAIQVLGGVGYTKEFPVERYYRDAKVTEIYEGTSEIQRIVIARAILAELDERSAVGAAQTSG